MHKTRIILLPLLLSLLFIPIVLLTSPSLQAQPLNQPVDTVIYHVVTTPAEDTRCSVTINYHCAFPNSYVEYTEAKDKNFKNAFTAEVLKTQLWSTKGLEKTSTASSFYTKPRYVCRITLTGLKPNTKYIYRIFTSPQSTSETPTYSQQSTPYASDSQDSRRDVICSEVKYFKTSAGKEKWNFVAFTDFQHYNNAITHPLIQNMKKRFNPPLAICSGDMVDVAGFEQSWKWLLESKIVSSGKGNGSAGASATVCNTAFSNVIFAASPGDHEFWADATNGKYPQYTEPHTYNHIFRFPQNGAKTALNSSYYFYYNNVLFISLDMNNSNISKGERFNTQAEWFQKTLDSLQGTYRYIVVYEHKSIFGSSIIDSAVGKYIRPQWYPLFQKYNVDLVLSGHDHIYSRTFQLDGNQISADPKKGTYYLDMGSSGDKRRALDRSLTDDDTLHAKVIDLKSEKLSCAANIEVTRREMKVSVYNQYMQLVDTFTIKAKR